jgi:hypothetical protein
MSDSLKQSTDSELIAADKVAGVSVFDRNREKLGSIKDLYIDKRTGHTEFASMSFGGVLGVGAKYYPLPWNALNYDTDLDGFVVDLDKRALEGGPAYAEDRLADEDYGWRDEVRGYYGGLPGVIAGGVY